MAICSLHRLWKCEFKKKFVLSFLAPKISIFFWIFSPTTMLAYFYSILSVLVCACECSMMYVCIFVLGRIFSLLVLPEFSLNFSEFPSKFAQIQGGDSPPWHPVSYAYGDPWCLRTGSRWLSSPLLYWSCKL